MRSNRIISCIMVVILFCMINCVPSIAEENMPSRVINVVYDDSGSMIKNETGFVDTWCQAKYSMEVFAAMLGENDTMNVYVMSDYDHGDAAAAPRLSLDGSSGAESNVKLVHDMITPAGNTPFNAVRKAYEDLQKADSDEKWLVILTDGAFEDGAFTNEQVDEYLSKKDDDISVMFLGMGESAAAITEDVNSRIYSEKAATNDQILEKITGICNRVFNSNKLSVDVGTGVFSFDVPMSELVVFAQGDNVKINGIVDPAGNSIAWEKKPVTVRYSEKPSSAGYANFIVDKKLNGSVATFRGDFPPGEYKAEVDSAKTIEVYYKPNVEIMLYLIDGNGDEVPYTDGVRSGDYNLKFGFVKSGTSEPVAKSDLLGDVEYYAQVNYNDGQSVIDCTDGDSITIEEGKYRIDAFAEYLKYNTVTTYIEFDVFRDKELLIEQLSSPEYLIDNSGISNADEPMSFKVSLEGQDIDPEEWKAFENGTITQTRHSDSRIKFNVEKGEAVGLYYVYPALTTEKPIIGDYGNIDYRFSVSHQSNRSTWSGQYEGTYTSVDSRSWILRHADKFIKLMILAFLVFIILGYVPGFKKYLPKKLKKHPKIEGESNTGARRSWNANGRYSKDIVSTLIPYRAERGTIKYLPRGNSAGPSLKVRALGSNKMEITNTRSFIGREDISFNGQTVQKGTRKNLSVTAGLRIKVETREAKYSCVLNK